jgi:hypothetical protein
MIRQLAQCPYCRRCEIALDDNPQIVFNPDEREHEPCPHLALVDCSYEERERDRQGVERVIGSTELRWSPDLPESDKGVQQFEPYLHELLEAGPDWEFAPQMTFAVQPMNAESTAHDVNGVRYTAWVVNGWSLFASDLASFWSALPACHQRHLESLRMEGET